MSIAEKIQLTINSPKKRICKFGILLSGSALSKNDKELILSILSPENENYSAVSNVQLSKILREEGFDISPSLVDRHKGLKCGCYFESSPRSR